MTNTIIAPNVGSLVLIFNPVWKTWALKKVVSNHSWLDWTGFQISHRNGETNDFLLEGYGITWLHENDSVPTDMELCLKKWKELNEVT